LIKNNIILADNQCKILIERKTKQIKNLSYGEFYLILANKLKLSYNSANRVTNICWRNHLQLTIQVLKKVMSDK